MLQGDDTPPEITTLNQGQQADTAQTVQQTEEEVEFNRLSGSAQDRIRELVRRARDAEEKITQTPPAYIPPAPGLMPDQKQALETLRGFGISTREDVSQQVAEGVNQIRWELKNQNLKGKYSGRDGEPQYNPIEVEDFMRNHPQYAAYDPEDVFLYKMYPDEFSAKRETAPKTRTQSLKPVRSSQRQDALTPDYIEQRLKQSDGDEWYEANKDEINKVVYNHTQQFKGTNFGGQ